ncbi:putative tail fiber protein [Rhizobium phage RHph_Y68]|uniref:Putative tail fiber protein n=1 Tax=Rhizobium phage RHph_Y68 TaxID=2509787 RepID=A0A7S5QXW5_9CAUD|nr:tail fiber protein [Rhizobium phage RHph_Y68]QIG67946.1 putative tail fiber protein [Rhizobium phage RHph_Y68]
MPVPSTPIQTASTSSDAGSLAVIVNDIIERLAATVALTNSNESGVGDLDELDTAVKTSVVAAINDLVSKFDSGELVSTYIGQLSNLNTNSKSTVVSAINEVNNKVGDITALETENTGNVVEAVNEVFAAIQALGDIDSGAIFDQLALRLVKTGDTMTGALNVLTGVQNADAPMIGIGWTGLQPSWKFMVDSAESYSMFAFDKTTGLVQGRRMTLDKTGNLTASGTVRAGSGSGILAADGNVVGNAWNAVGGLTDAVASINAKFSNYYLSTGGTLTGKIIESIGTTGAAVTFRDLKIGNAANRSWEEMIDASEAWILRSHNKSNDAILQTAMKLSLNGDVTFAGTMASGDITVGGAAQYKSDGTIIGSAWNTFGASTNAISAIQNYVSNRLAAAITIPNGGTTGQALVKASNTDGDYTWGGPYALLVHTHAIADVTGLQPALDAKATIASPTFTGDPKAPTAALGDNDTSIATTAFVQAAIGSMGKRSLTVSTSAPTSGVGVDGDVWFQV